jgi:rRNA maturation endonuclease Nob1
MNPGICEKMFYCKGICVKLELRKPHSRFRRYVNGHKRCRQCNMFIDWPDGLPCPCCGSRLRMNPRMRESKEVVRTARQKH